jgi:hypothetical protein
MARSYFLKIFATFSANFAEINARPVGNRPDGKRLGRKDFARPLTPIRMLRNRIAHHEPIIDWKLRKHHDRMLELTQWLSPAAAAWCRQIDRFDEVYPAAHGQLAVG